MDNLTHSLFALTLAQTPLRRAGRGTTAALLLSSNAPDIDIVAAFAGGSTAYLSVHRGPTHGLLGIVGLAAVTVLLVRCVQRLRGDGTGTGRASSRALYGVAVLGIACHILMDLPTSYGTRLFSPFSEIWYATDWLPIIDIYLLVLLAAGLILARIGPAARGRIASAVLVLMAANYAFRATMHHLALERAAGDMSGMVTSLHRWADSAGSKLPAERTCAPLARPTFQDTQASSCLIDAAALPTFLSPFRWRLIQEYSTGYALTDIDLTRRSGSAPLSSTWRDSDRGPAVAAASSARTAQALLSFSRFPAARVIDDEGDDGGHDEAPGQVDRSDGSIVVQIEEVRFLGGADQLREDTQARGFFRLLVRLGQHGQVLEEHFGN